MSFFCSKKQLLPRYDYPTFLGAILLMKVTDFELVKGMSNQYWGWGMEDDEFYHRLKEARLEVRRPEGIKTGTEDTFLHIHGPRKHARDFQGGQTGFSLNTLHIQAWKSPCEG